MDRGAFSLPIIDIDAVRRTLRAASAKAPLRGGHAELMPWNIRLLDINLLTFDSDIDYINVESTFFSEHKEEGDFKLWPMNGIMPMDMERGCDWSGLRGSACPVTTRQPSDIGNLTIRNRIASKFPSWDPDHLSKRVEELHGLVHNSENTAIFFHCSCGCDRTGQLFAAYAIAHLNWTVQEALNHNVAIAGRPLWYEHQISVQWYCEWLRSTGRYLHDDCSRCGGNILCSAAEFYLDPFARRLEAQIAVAVLSCLALGAVLCALRWRGKRWCHRDRSYYDDDLSEGLLTPMHRIRKGFLKDSWIATPSTASPSSSPAMSNWRSSRSSSLSATPVFVSFLSSPSNKIEPELAGESDVAERAAGQIAFEEVC